MIPEADSGRGWGGRGGCAIPRPSPPYFFAITCCCFLQSLVVVFCNHFEELQTVLFEVEMIINNASLTYVYPNTIETPSHLLFGR